MKWLYNLVALFITVYNHVDLLEEQRSSAMYERSNRRGTIAR